MTKLECRMTKEVQNDEARKESGRRFRHLSFVINSSFVIRVSSFSPPYSKSLLPEDLRRRLREEESRRIYGLGDVSAAGDSVVVAGDSAVVAGLVVSVVVGGLVAAGLATGSVVSVFCSHAARSAAPARMQMYFFIVLIGRVIML
jgi:hypothetical protein